tara:strand:+ start:42272 stop:42523 length:252 start_codon:yes stop_codon:yes gene_type:complete
MTKSDADIIADLEAKGYSVTPPRDTQVEFENNVGLWLQSWHRIVGLHNSGFIEMRDRSRTTLSIVYDELGKLLGNAEQKKDAA